MEKYPARWIGAVMSALTLLVAFGVIALTPAQLGAVSAFLVALAGVIPLIQGLFTERRVFSPATRARDLEEAEADGFDLGHARGHEKGKARDR